MLRLLTYIVVLLVAGVFLARLIDIPGYVSLEWMGWQVDTSPLFLVFLLGVLVLVMLVAFWLVDRMVTLPRRYRNQKRLEQHERGLSALTEALAALAVSDLSNAKKLTKRAEKLLGSVPITHLLTAQLAKLEGDDAKASQHLKHLLDHKETHFLAARGLLEQARKTGDVESAVAYAQEAGSIRPDSSFAALSMLDIYTSRKSWQQALDVLRRAQKHRAFTAQEAARFKALIEYEHARYLYEKDDFGPALRYAKQAYKILPDMVPAAVLFAEILLHTGNRRKAGKILAASWKIIPHPDLFATYKKLIADQLPAKRVQRVEKFVSSSPDDAESHLAIGQAALDAGDYAKARQEAKQALEMIETARACQLISQIEAAEGNAEKAEKWRQRAEKNQPNPAWICENCKETAAEWALHCPSCNGFDSVHWRVSRLPFVYSKTASPPPPGAITV